MVALQDIQHQHVRPKIGLAAQAGERLAGTEPAVVALRVHDSMDPLAGLGDDGGIFEHVTQIAVSFEPVRQLLPAEVAAALLIGPGAFVKIEPGGNFGQMADHALFLQLQLTPQPAPRSNAADGQFHQRAGGQRLTVAGIVAIACGRCRHINNADIGQAHRSGHKKGEDWKTQSRAMQKHRGNLPKVLTWLPQKPGNSTVCSCQENNSRQENDGSNSGISRGVLRTLPSGIGTAQKPW